MGLKSFGQELPGFGCELDGLRRFHNAFPNFRHKTQAVLDREFERIED